MKDAPATLDRPPWCQACIELMPKMPIKWIPKKAEPGSDLCVGHRQLVSVTGHRHLADLERSLK